MSIATTVESKSAVSDEDDAMPVAIDPEPTVVVITPTMETLQPPSTSHIPNHLDHG